MTTNQKWTEERVETLVGIVGADQVTPVTADVQHAAAEQLNTNIRSIGAKLRNLGYATATTASTKTSLYTPEQEEELRAFVESNPNTFTYAEIAEQVLNGEKTAKQIQGKLLSMELFSLVKPSPKAEVAKKYSDEEEAQFIEMMKAGAFLEEIAEAMNRPINSVRGKALSIVRKDSSLTIPRQKESHAKEAVADVLDSVDNIEEMTVAELSEKLNKSERGVKTMLTRRGIDVANYKGAAKAAKNAEAKANAEAE